MYHVHTRPTLVSRMARRTRITPVKHVRMKRTLSELLQERADETGITDTDAGRACGVRQTTYGRWRRGASLPDDVNVAAIAAFLGRTEDAIDGAIREHRRRARRGRLTTIEGGRRSSRQRVRNPRQIDSALTAVEAEVKRQADELKRQADELDTMRALTEALRSTLQNRPRKQP